MNRLKVEEAIDSLDALLHSDTACEADFQAWFENHPVAFIILGFQRQIPHPSIHAASGDTYIPDFIAQRPNGAWEIFELKTAAADILRDKNRREAFYASFESYLSQCHEYAEALDDSAVRDDVEKRYDINLLQKRPSSIIVAGSSEALDVERLFRLCSRRTPPVTVYTYDDVRAALVSYRTFNFGSYDSADGISVHSVMYLHRPDNGPSINHILDIGVNPDRDRVSIYVDEKGFIRIKVFDSNGEQHSARSAAPLDPHLYETPHWFLFEVGISDGFGFISIQIDGRYYADMRLHDFPIHISHEYVIGSDWHATAPSWFSFIELAVIDRALSFNEKVQMREHSMRAGKDFSAEIMGLNWSAYYSAGAGRLEFKGHKWMHTAGHPAGRNKEGL